MHYARLAILAVSIGVGFIASAQQPTKTHPKADIATGRELFHQHCSTCHGVDGKGPGPGSTGPFSNYDPESIDPAKRVKPTDLTVLSDQNSGKFPAGRVRDAIYFKGSIPAHGTPNMPAWGNVFYLLKDRPKLLEKRVSDLTGYIESIQATKK